MRNAEQDTQLDPTAFSGVPGTSVQLCGAGDDGDVLVADWSVETLIEIGRHLKLARRHLDAFDEAPRRTAALPATSDGEFSAAHGALGRSSLGDVPTSSQPSPTARTSSHGQTAGRRAADDERPPTRYGPSS